MRARLAIVALLLGLAAPAAAQNPFSLINFGQCAADTNSGNKSCGTLRIILATDQPNLATALNVNVFGIAQSASQYLTFRLSDGSAYVPPSTDYTHNVALTVASTAGPMSMFRASAAAPANVSADDKSVIGWALPNGSQVVNLAAGGVLFTAGAGGGLKIDGSGTALPVSFTMPSLVAGAAIIGKVGIDQTTPGTSNAVAVTNSFLLDATYTGRTPAGASPANAESNTNTALSRIGGYNFIFNGSTWDRWTGAVTGTVAVSNAFALDATVTGRLPAGGSPADAESNTNTNLSRIGGYNFLFNGTTWDRQRGDTTNGAFVNVKTSVLPSNAAAETGGNLAGIKTNTDRPTTVTQGQKTVAVTNTAVALATTTTIRSVTAKALAANAAAVYVGGSGVTTANGFALNPNDTVSLAIADLATVFINGTAGDGVSFVAVN